MSKTGRFLFRTAAPLGLEGVEAEALWEHGCRGVVEEGSEVVGYFDRITSLPLEGSWQELADDDYLERYYLALDCVNAGPLVVAPTHRSAQLSSGQKVLWLDPGMAFGTGHHETTRLALTALAEAEPLSARVLDLGSGSGVLAIAADLLGAVSALGLDIDPATIPVARDNAALNRSRASFEMRELRETDEADILVANLYAELHVELADAYAAALPPGGRLLITGILADRVDMVESALAANFYGWRRQADGEWRLLYAVRRAR